MSKKFTLFLRTITYVLLLCFCMEQVAYARGLGGAAARSPSQNLLLQDIIGQPNKLPIPREFVQVKEVFQAKDSNKLIIHIQDAHSNLSGQKNLAKALDALLKQFHIPTILVEGASTDASLHHAKDALLKKRPSHSREKTSLLWNYFRGRVFEPDFRS